MIKRWWIGIFVGAVTLAGTACGSDDSGGSNGGAGGAGGTSGTTCADGYPKIGAACAIDNEKCTSCPTGYACCDIFQCAGAAWTLAQSKSACPDAGSDAADDTGADGAGDAASDGSSE